MPLERITLFCFGASYAVAFALELLYLFWPRPVERLVGLTFAVAGLLAHTLYLIVHHPPLSSQFGSLVLLAEVLAIFYLFGSLHYRRVAWGVFVLPLVCTFVALAGALERTLPDFETGEQSWRAIHTVLLLLAAVGISVAFLASVMYLVQAHRLKAKVLPGHGLRLLSLERLEQMNRRAVNLAFPLLTAGLVVGFVLQANAALHVPWTDPKLLASGLLWLLFVVLVYLRFSNHLRGRRAAVLTIIAFTLMVFTMTWPHLGNK